MKSQKTKVLLFTSEDEGRTVRNMWTRENDGRVIHLCILVSDL